MNIYCLTLIDTNKLSLQSELVLRQKPSFWPIVSITAICFSGQIFMQFNIHVLYVQKVRCSKCGNNILTNKKNGPIVCMRTIRYISLIWLVSTYLQRAAIRNMCPKCIHLISKLK